MDDGVCSAAGMSADGCPNATAVPREAWLSTIRAYQVLERVAHDGEHSLRTTVGSGYPNVPTYAATHDGAGENRLRRVSGKPVCTLPPWSMTVAIVSP